MSTLLPHELFRKLDSARQSMTPPTTPDGLQAAAGSILSLGRHAVLTVSRMYHPAPDMVEKMALDLHANGIRLALAAKNHEFTEADARNIGIIVEQTYARADDLLKVVAREHSARKERLARFPGSRQEKELALFREDMAELRRVLDFAAIVRTSTGPYRNDH